MRCCRDHRRSFLGRPRPPHLAAPPGAHIIRARPCPRCGDRGMGASQYLAYTSAYHVSMKTPRSPMRRTQPQHDRPHQPQGNAVEARPAKDTRSAQTPPAARKRSQHVWLCLHAGASRRPSPCRSASSPRPPRASSWAHTRCGDRPRRSASALRPERNCSPSVGPRRWLPRSPKHSFAAVGAARRGHSRGFQRSSLCLIALTRALCASLVPRGAKSASALATFFANGCDS